MYAKRIGQRSHRRSENKQSSFRFQRGILSQQAFWLVLHNTKCSFEVDNCNKPSVCTNLELQGFLLQMWIFRICITHDRWIVISIKATFNESWDRVQCSVQILRVNNNARGENNMPK